MLPSGFRDRRPGDFSFRPLEAEPVRSAEPLISYNGTSGAIACSVFCAAERVATCSPASKAGDVGVPAVGQTTGKAWSRSGSSWSSGAPFEAILPGGRKLGPRLPTLVVPGVVDTIGEPKWASTGQP